MSPKIQPMLIVVVAAMLVAGCATKPRLLMPTPVLYRAPDGSDPLPSVRFSERTDTDIELLYITDRAEQSDPEDPLPYGGERSKQLSFGTARVRFGDGISGEELLRESRSGERASNLTLSLGQVTKLGAFPREPYDVRIGADGYIYRAEAELRAHDTAKSALQDAVQARLAESERKEVVLYVHGFNETFETAAFTIAELCHFLGRESVCAFFTWPSSTTGNFLISYTNTTESADYAVGHLKKTIRTLATTPGVEKVQLLAHSRGTALLLDALRELLLEVIAAGQEPAEVLDIDNVVLFSPDIDVDVASQTITAHVSDPDLISVWPSRRIPRSLKGRMTVYSSPQDRALLVSRILFRSQSRVGNLRAENIGIDAQNYLKQLGRIDLIIYEGRRTDAFGHSYFTTNPRVSSDVIQLLRYGKRLGEPGRELEQESPIVWRFPSEPADATP